MLWHLICLSLYYTNSVKKTFWKLGTFFSSIKIQVKNKRQKIKDKHHTSLKNKTHLFNLMTFNINLGLSLSNRQNLTNFGQPTDIYIAILLFFQWEGKKEGVAEAEPRSFL